MFFMEKITKTLLNGGIKGNPVFMGQRVNIAKMGILPMDM